MISSMALTVRTVAVLLMTSDYIQGQQQQQQHHNSNSSNDTNSTSNSESTNHNNVKYRWGTTQIPRANSIILF